MNCTPLDKFGTIPHGNIPLTMRFHGTKAFYDDVELKAIFEEHGAAAHVRSFGLNVNITYFHPFSICRFMANDGAKAIALRRRTDLLSVSLDDDLAEALWFGGGPHVNDVEEGERFKKHVVALLQSAACSAKVNVFLIAELDVNRRELIVRPSPSKGKNPTVNFEITSFFSAQKKIFMSNPIKWNNAPRPLLIRCADSTYVKEWMRRRDDRSPLTDDEQLLIVETDAHLGNETPVPPVPVKKPDYEVIVIDDEEDDAPPLKKSRMSIEEKPDQPTTSAPVAPRSPAKDDVINDMNDGVNIEDAVQEAIDEVTNESDDNDESNALHVDDDPQDDFPLQERSDNISDEGRSESSSIIFLPTPSPPERRDEAQKGDNPQGADHSVNDGSDLMSDGNLDDSLPDRIGGTHDDSDEPLLPAVRNDEPADQQCVQPSSLDGLSATMDDDLPSTSTGHRGGLERVSAEIEKSKIQHGNDAIPSTSAAHRGPSVIPTSRTSIASESKKAYSVNWKRRATCLQLCKFALATSYPRALTATEIYEIVCENCPVYLTYANNRLKKRMHAAMKGCKDIVRTKDNVKIEYSIRNEETWQKLLRDIASIVQTVAASHFNDVDERELLNQLCKKVRADNEVRPKHMGLGYPEMVALALDCSPTAKLPVEEIYEFITTNFHSAIVLSNSWKKNVRHALSFYKNTKFGLEEKPETQRCKRFGGPAGLWYILPASLDKTRTKIAPFRHLIAAPLPPPTNASSSMSSVTKSYPELSAILSQRPFQNHSNSVHAGSLGHAEKQANKNSTTSFNGFTEEVNEMRTEEGRVDQRLDQQAETNANQPSKIASTLDGNVSNDGDASAEDDEILILECTKLFDEIFNCDDRSDTDEEELEDEDDQEEEEEKSMPSCEEQHPSSSTYRSDEERMTENGEEKEEAEGYVENNLDDQDEIDLAEPKERPALRRSRRFEQANRQEGNYVEKADEKQDEEEEEESPELRRSRRFEPAKEKDDEENEIEEEEEDDESPKSSDEKDDSTALKESPSLRRSKRTRKNGSSEEKKQPTAQDIEDLWINAPVTFNRKYKMLLEYHEKTKAVRDALKNDDKAALREAYADLIQMRLIRTMGIFDFMKEYGHRHPRFDLATNDRNNERAYQRSIASVAEKWNEALPDSIQVYIFDWTGKRSGVKEIKNVEFLNELVRSPEVQALLAKTRPFKGTFCRNCCGHSRNNSKDLDVFCCQIGLEEHAFLRFICSRKCEGTDQEKIDLESKRSVPIGIFRNHKTGWSVRVLTKFAKDQFVTQALGEVNNGPSEDPDHDFPMGYTHPDGETELVIALGEKGNEVRFLNHSCNPNLVVTSMMEERYGYWYCRKYFHAKREILEGEEITFDYVAGKRRLAKDLEIIKTCFCGAAKCYWKTIRG